MIYFCATPIGNLEDISLRALRILKEVDVIAAEDTRHALKLLNHYGISKKVISYHHYNRKFAGQKIIDIAKSEKSVAILSDAGMPGISDPGSELVCLARENDIPITVIPGPCAALSALLLSGFDSSRFTFEGFLPRDKKLRRARVQSLKNELRSTIIYEAPHRLIKTLEELQDALGNRNIAIARELTKFYEEAFVCDIAEAISRFKQSSPRGEFTIVIHGATQDATEENLEVSVKKHVERYISAGMDKKEAIKQVALERKVPKSQIYKHMIEEQNTDL